MTAPPPYVHQLTDTCYGRGALCGKVHDPTPLNADDSPAVHAIAAAFENQELISDLYWLTEGCANDSTSVSMLAEVARHLAAVAEAAA